MQPDDRTSPQTLPPPPPTIPPTAQRSGADVEDAPPNSEITIPQEVRFDPQTWQADQYVSIYYPTDQIGMENRALLESQVEIWRKIDELDAAEGPEYEGPRSVRHGGADMVVLGGGGTMWDIPAAAPHVRGICYTDPHENSRGLVQQYMDTPGDTRWHQYIACTLRYEGVEVTEQAVQERAALMRERVVNLSPCDVRRRPPVTSMPTGVRVVAVHFVLDSITNSRTVWRWLIRNTASIVGDRGYLILSSLGKASGWRSNLGASGVPQPAVWLKPEDFSSVLESLGFEVFHLRWIPAEEANLEDYQGLIACAARRRPRR